MLVGEVDVLCGGGWEARWTLGYELGVSGSCVP